MTIAREGRWQEENSESALLEADDLPGLEALCLEKIRGAAASNQLLEYPRLLSLLFQWARWAPGEPREWVSGLIGSPEGLLGFLRGSLSRVRSVSTGDYLPVDAYVIRLKEIEEFAVVDEISRALERLSEDELSAEEIEAVEAFRRALRRRAEGKEDDDWHDD